jgi:hypothetical protein
MWHYMKNKEPSVFVNDARDGVDKVLAGNYAYLMESTSIEYQVQQNCDLMQVGGLLDSKGFGVATPMGKINGLYSNIYFFLIPRYHGKVSFPFFFLGKLNPVLLWGVSVLHFS